MALLDGSDPVGDLKRILFVEYGGFADKRIKKLENGKRFIVDDRSDRDIAADGNLYPWFCMIFIEVGNTAEAVDLIFSGDIPISTTVESWFADHAAVRQGDRGRIVTLHRGQQGNLTGLAAAFRQIVSPNRRYPKPSYKYVCPRTAGSLDRLRRVLERAWR